MVRILVFLLGLFTADRPRPRQAAWHGARYAPVTAGGGTDTAPYPSGYGPERPTHARTPLGGHAGPGEAPPDAPAPWGTPPPRRRRLPRLLTWGAVLLVAGLIFRRAIAAIVLMVLSGAFHLVGLDVHLPHVKFAWPWQTISAGTTTNADLGPWVLQKIEGISKPALGQVTFNFYFTHKVSKNIGPWPCWYASTFYAVGHAAATVNLNPGPAWWAPSARHYELRVLSRPAQGRPGRVADSMVLPRPQLPQSVHDITIDNIPSRPIDTQHSWTYPGLGCGVVLKPQFPQAVLYSQAQYIAFYKATRVAQVTGPLVRTAEAQAVRTIRDNFIQPTVNALGYALDQFTLRWAAPAGPGQPSASAGPGRSS